MESWGNIGKLAAARMVEWVWDGAPHGLLNSLTLNLIRYMLFIFGAL